MRRIAILHFIAKFIVFTAATALPSSSSASQPQPQATRKLAVPHLSLAYDVAYSILSSIRVEVEIESREGDRRGSEAYGCISNAMLQMPFYPDKIRCVPFSQMEQFSPTLSLSIKGDGPRMSQVMPFINRSLLNGPLLVELTYQDDTRNNGEAVTADIEIPIGALKRVIKIGNNVVYRNKVSGKPLLEDVDVPF